MRRTTACALWAAAAGLVWASLPAGAQGATAQDSAPGSVFPMPRVDLPPILPRGFAVPGLAERHALAERLYAEGDLAGAERACRQGIALAYAACAAAGVQSGGAPKELLGLLGEVLLDAGRNEESADCFIQCTGVTDAKVEFGTVIALCRARAGAEAVAALRRVAHHQGCEEELFGKDPDVPGTSTLAGIEASALMERATLAVPFSAERAARDLLQARRLAPRSAAVAYRLGAVLDRKGDWADAAIWYERAAATGRGDWARRARRAAPVARACAEQAAQLRRQSSGGR